MKEILDDREEIRLVSIAAVDLIGHETDGSSVFLPKIATLNNAKVDMKADVDCNWFVEYNNDLLDPTNAKPIGTIKIPCYLFHEGVPVDSRHILAEAERDFKSNILNIFKENSKMHDEFNLKYEDIMSAGVTAATELEFWVKSPSAHGDIDTLRTSQELKEQCWGKDQRRCKKCD